MNGKVARGLRCVLSSQSGHLKKAVIFDGKDKTLAVFEFRGF